MARPIIANAGQKHCRMLQKEHSAILSTFIKLPVVIKTFVMSILEWPFYTGFTVLLVYNTAWRNKCIAHKSVLIGSLGFTEMVCFSTQNIC